MLLTATVALAGKSTTTIPMGQAFVLGGDQTKPLTVSGKNVGPVAVRIVARRGSAKKLLATVAPGGNIGGTFAVGDAAVIENTSSTKSAVISVEFNASVNSLTMDYKPVGK
jgi:hypothetical protein